MTERYVLENCIAWNAAEMRKAARDATNGNIMVPRHALKRVSGKLVQLTPDEYRASRANDALRHEGNIATLEARL